MKNKNKNKNKNKVYCDACKYIRYPSSMRLAMLGKEKSQYKCAYTKRDHDTPISKCIKMDNCIDKNANNDCPDFKLPGLSDKLFSSCNEYN